jgi:hypothetical protein
VIDVALTQLQLLEQCKLLGVMVPDWLEERFIADYCDCALAHGEEQAVIYVRKLKREAEMAELSRLVSQS